MAAAQLHRQSTLAGMTKAATKRAPETAQAIFDEVRRYCVAKADPALVKKYARFFREGYDAYGVSDKDPDWAPNRKRWAERLKSAGERALFEAGELLIRTGKYEEASFAIILMADASDLRSVTTFRAIERWFDGGICNWAHTDVLAREVVSKLVRNRAIEFNTFLEWRSSPHKFQRRAVPVTLIYCLDACRNAAPLLHATEPLMTDAEHAVQQGTGWFLREAWKRWPADVERFLLKYKNTAARVIVQYATEKMDRSKREQFRRER